MHYAFLNSHRGCVAVMIILTSLLLVMRVQLLRTDRRLDEAIANENARLPALRTATPTPPPQSGGDQYYVQQTATYDYALLLPQNSSVDEISFPIMISSPINLLVRRDMPGLYEGWNTLSLFVFTQYVSSTSIDLDQLVHLARALAQMDKKHYYEEFSFSFLPWEERPSPTTVEYVYNGTAPLVVYAFNTIGLRSQSDVILSIYRKGSGPLWGPYSAPQVLYPVGPL